MSSSNMKILGGLLAACLSLAIALPAAPAGEAVQGVTGRPPAVPLITHDPYFSVWSASDRLTDEWTKHWTGRNQPLSMLVMIDGKPFRAMGPEPNSAPALEQKGLVLTPTRTIYTLDGPGVEMVLTFLSPLLIQDLDVMSRPASYITADIHSTDGASHAVIVYFGAGSALAVNTRDQNVFWGRDRVPGLEVMAMGCQAQDKLAKAGDDLRIDWGWLYLAAPSAAVSGSAFGIGYEARTYFAAKGGLPDSDLTEKPRPSGDDITASMVLDYGRVGGEAVSRHVILAYDDVFSIEYLYRRLRPYWRRNGWDAKDLLLAAEKDYDSLNARCAEFDAALLRDMRKAGGEKYAFIAVLAYRQSIAAHKLAADYDGTPLFFPKENFSNGCIATVDVIYPAAPEYLLLNPDLVRATLTPVMQYAATSRWPFSFAPHDLGTYPLADGQVYGEGERGEEDQMPVEESGNMIILTAALAQVEGKTDFAERWWPLLAKWAGYLKLKGLDPENQLCTDDFAGHLAHNANLSLKAILALKSYGWLAGKTGRKAEAKEFNALAAKYAAEWLKMADEGDHYRLAFDNQGSWSQKYNLVWDGILGFNLFPRSVEAKELGYYLRVQNKYGLPLDNRKTYTKLDWILWTAAMAPDGASFAALIDPVYAFLNETKDRVPMTDWFWTDSGLKTGFQARSVVGGVLIRMLADPQIRKNWVPAGGK